MGPKYSTGGDVVEIFEVDFVKLAKNEANC